MALHLTVDRALAVKVIGLVTDVDDALLLLLALGVVAEDEEEEPELAVEPGSTYVPPAKRLVEWTRMAGEMSAEGRTPAEVAVALAIDEDLAAELIGNWWAGIGR